MIPQYVRLVLPSNKNIQVLVPAQQPLLQGLQYSSPRPIRPSNSVSSLAQSPAAPLLAPSNSVPVLTTRSLNVEQQTSDKMSSASVPTDLNTLDDVTTKNTVKDTNISDTSKLKFHIVEKPFTQQKKILLFCFNYFKIARVSALLYKLIVIIGSCDVNSSSASVSTKRSRSYSSNTSTMDSKKSEIIESDDFCECLIVPKILLNFST